MIEIKRGTVDPRAAATVLRMLHLDMLDEAHDYLPWKKKLDWFPHLKHDPQVLALTHRFPVDWQTGEICDPQIILHFPHPPEVPEPEVTYHLDKEPEWANGRRYLRIVGVPLTTWYHSNGGLMIRYRSTLPSLEMGDAICMSPDVWHSPGINRSPEIRYGVYFRWLEVA